MSQAQSQPPFVENGIPPDVRSYATFTHIVPLISHLGGPIVVPIVAAIIMWQIKKDQSPFIDDHGREAVNFQISLAIYWLVVIPLFTILTPLPTLWWVDAFEDGLLRPRKTSAALRVLRDEARGAIARARAKLPATPEDSSSR